MSDSSSMGGVLAALAIGAVVIGGAQGQQGGGNDTATAAPASTGGDVIVGVHSSGSRGALTHYAECGPGIDAEPAYEVEIPESIAYDDIEGDPCPDGPHQPTARDRNPELYDELLRTQQEPLEFAGGDINKPCGTWETSIPEAARQLAVECPPLTRGDLR